MGYDEQCALVPLEVILQPDQGLEVQMVGGLVQDQQFRFLQQQLAESQTGLFTAGQRRDQGFPVPSRKAHTVEDGIDLHIDEVSVPGLEFGMQAVVFLQQSMVVRELPHTDAHGFHLPFDLIERRKDTAHLRQDGTAAVQAAVLAQEPDAYPGSDGPFAAFKFQVAAEDIEKGGFSRSIDADQADPVLIFYFERNMVMNQFRTVIFRDLFQRSYHFQ